MDKDQQLKELEKARAGAGVVARKESPQDAAARLDERIAEQRRENSLISDAESKERARASGSRPGVALAPYEAGSTKPSPPRSGVNSSPGAYQVHELNAMESEIAAKVRTSSNGVADASLASLESDVLAKARTRPSGSYMVTPVAQRNDIRSEIAELEAQVTGKPRRASTGDSMGQTDLKSFESDVAAKARARNPGQSSSTPGARNELAQLESDVAAKNKARFPSLETSVGARHEIGSGENAVRQKITEAHPDKQQAIRGAPTSITASSTHSIRDLEERIAYKTGIPLDNAPVPGEETVVQEQSNDSKTVGISPAALDKLQAQLEGVSIAALEHKLDGLQPASSGVALPDVEHGEDDGGDRLAVAIAVQEGDEDDGYIPAAVEYDPDAKPPMFRNRRFRLYSLLACTLIVVMIAGVVGLLTTKSEASPVDESAPVAAPTRVGSLGIEEQLELVVGAEVLNDPESAHFLAKEWIINDDPLQLTSTSDNLVQRYLLAVIYFKFHESGDWLSCNARTEDDPDDFCLYQKLIGVFPVTYSSVTWYRWLSGIHECSWAGLFCDEFNQLRSIELMGQEISGTLPMEFKYFPFLQGINFGWNEMHGTLPPEWGELPHLLNLEVHYNQITGGIPSEWTTAKNLQLLNLASNELTGTIPNDIGGMSNLRGIFLFENSLTGTFPTELTQLSLLTYIRLQRNFLTGSLPSEIGNLSPREVWFHRMPLSGTIPSEIGNMQGVYDLRLHSTEIHGTIPEELYRLTEIWRLDLYYTQISGTLSSSIAQLTELDHLRLRDMKLTGTIPTELVSIPDLGTLWFEGNDFTGEVPPGLCNDKGPTGIDEIVADCLESSDTGVPRVACACCDICCDHATGVCSSM